MKRLTRARNAVIAFLFPEQSDAWLSILRVGLGFVVLCYAISLANDWNFLFATSGPALVTRDFSEALLSLQSKFVPRLGWLVDVGQRFGLKEQVVLRLAWICLLASGLGVILGIFSRFAAVLAWFLHLCAARSGSFVSYGVDDFTTIGLFYLMLSPLPDRVSVDRMLRKVRPASPAMLGFFSARSAITFVTHLLFQRPNEMFGEWLVEWRESLARADTAALQRCLARFTR